MFDAYSVLPGVYDEAFEATGRPRELYAGLLAALAETDLEELSDRIEGHLRGARVTFTASPSGYLALDPVPRLIAAAEWKTIDAGIAQRARALERFAEDVYGEREIVSAGVVPARVIESSEHYEPAMRGGDGPRVWISVIGFDLVRSPDGRFRVLEDQIRMPSGIAYAVAARSALDEVGPTEPTPRVIDDAFGSLGEALSAATPRGGEPANVVVLTAGPDAAGWYEHERLGQELGLPVLTTQQLERRGEQLIAHVGDSPIKVGVVYQRTDEDRFTDPEGRPTPIGELLLEPCRAGRVACVNAPGAGVGDDKLVHAYVEEMVRFYLGEEPVLESVETFDLGDRSVRERALANREDLVFKPRAEMGGEGVVVWSEASEDERAEVERRLQDSPDGMIAQKRVELSTHPTVRDGELAPRRVDLRPYVIRTPDREWVMPGGLTRVALEEGSLIVNSGQGGGVKDTWVLAGE
jgi:uncharacterized circularly permuted ATP-grasp superfamily protein